jgi:hypothetical protein
MCIQLDRIEMDDEIRPRDRLSEAAIMEYGEAMLAGDELPRVRVFVEGMEKVWLADGWLRVEAAKAIGRVAIDVEATGGTRRDALLYSCGANAHHGFRRKNADKRRAVLKLLKDEEWQAWSDREIARACRVSPGLVAAVRAEISIRSNEQMDEVTVRRARRGDQEYDIRMPLSKGRDRHQPERWALVHLYDDVDVAAGAPEPGARGAAAVPPVRVRQVAAGHGPPPGGAGAGDAVKRSPIRRVNPERAEKRREEQFGEEAEVVRWMPCCLPRCRARPPSDPHHARSRAAGGGKKDLVPLCHPHHVEVHAVGRKTFEAAYGIDLRTAAAMTAAAVALELGDRELRMLKSAHNARRTKDE